MGACRPARPWQENRQMRKDWRLFLLFALAVAISFSSPEQEPPAPVMLAPEAVEPAAGAVMASATATAPWTLSGPANETALEICSFNIQFLGLFTKRDSPALASILDDCDIVAVQELVAPPYAGIFPNGEEYKPDAEAAEFFEAMKALGFDYALSPEDTGKSVKNHNNGSATEWWVAFYRPDRVEPEGDVASQFLAEDRTAHPDYDRVPYAFAFRTWDDNLDFVLISVHLRPGPGPKNRERRAHELDSIAKWIDDHDNDVEKDFVILGDMNIENKAELANATPEGFISLNDECWCTNTNPKSGKPYDHVMYNPTYTTELDKEFNLMVVNLIDAMRGKWESSDPYPGDPYEHDEFRMTYSDHNPVKFRMVIPVEDDDTPEQLNGHRTTPRGSDPQNLAGFPPSRWARRDLRLVRQWQDNWCPRKHSGLLTVAWFRIGVNIS
jgi:hypothetical protein